MVASIRVARLRRNIYYENKGPRHNLRISHPPRGHPTYLPHPSLTIATNRAKPRIWLRGEKTGQEEDRMGPSNISPPSSTTGIEEPPSLREMGRSPRRRIYGTQKWKTGLHGYTAKTDPEDMWPNHKTLRKGWWCRAFATAINRQCPTCNRLRTTEQFPPSLTQCLTCTRVGNKKKSSQFKLLDSQVG